MSKNSLYLALDQGGHASRAVVFGAGGQTILSQSEIPIVTHHPQPGWVEHDADALALSVQQAADAAVGALPDTQRRRIARAGLATQRSTIVCWDHRTGVSLSPAISWQDRRNQVWMEQFTASAARIRQITGLLPSPHYGVSKFQWCLSHLPDVQLALRKQQLRYGPLSSFLVMRLTQEHCAVCDPANASRTLLCNLSTTNWDTELLNLFKLPADPLPAIVHSAASHGHLVCHGVTIPLDIVTGDQAAAVFAAGPPLPDRIFINAGTGAFIQRVTQQVLPAGRGLLRSVVFADQQERWYAQEGTVNGAGSALTWFAQQEGVDDVTGQSAVWLARCTAPPIFINAIGGLGAPFWRPAAQCAYLGGGDLPCRFCAVVESIAFLIMSNLEQLGLSAAHSHIWLTGGLGQMDGFCQRLADLSGMTVFRPRNFEATLQGLAYLLSREIPASVPTDKFAPSPNGALHQRYRLWQDAMTGNGYDIWLTD